MCWPRNMLIRTTLCVGALLGVVISAAGCAASSVRMLGTPGTKVPRVLGHNLNRERVEFPDDIRGRPTLLLIAFYRHQQRDIDTWLGRLGELERAVPDLNVLELPVLRKAYVFMRPYIDGGMRSGIPDPAARARTITLYTDKQAFREALGLGSEDRVYAVLADRQGSVVCVVEGPATDRSVEVILKACRGT